MIDERDGSMGKWSELTRLGSGTYYGIGSFPCSDQN